MPTTRYARNGDVSLAYQVFGEGDIDLVLITGWVISMESLWQQPLHARFYERLGSFARVICMDKRGTGLSDRVSPDSIPTLEERMDDVGAVMDAVGSESAALFGLSEGSHLLALFAATHPERTEALVMYGGFPRLLFHEELPWMIDPEGLDDFIEGVSAEWANLGRMLSLWAPSVADDPTEQERFARAIRQGASPGAGVAWLRMGAQVDIRDVLPTIRVPTLVMARRDEILIPPECSEYMSERIPGARYVALPGEDHLWWYGNQDDILNEVEKFLTGRHRGPEPDRLLATVMFTDIVGSTAMAAKLGDRDWRQLRERHDELVRSHLERHRGEELNTMGDGFLATFDGPARAIRCAAAIRDAVRPLGMEIRVGLHTGECERMNGDLGGIAVSIGARIEALADSGEVLVSGTVKDLVAGSGIEFEDRGTHELKGVPGHWQLFAADPG